MKKNFYVTIQFRMAICLQYFQMFLNTYVEIRRLYADINFSYIFICIFIPQDFATTYNFVYFRFPRSRVTL